MFFIVYAFKGQVDVFAGRVKIASHFSCRTSAILKYFCPLYVQKFAYIINLLYFFFDTGFKKCSSQVQCITADHTETAGQFDD